MNHEWREAFTIRNAKILGGSFRNFSGRPDDYNRGGGKRSFCVQLDDDTLEMLREAGGYNIKPLKKRDEDDEDRFQIKVIVSYMKKEPRIKVINDGVENFLTEDSVGMLDQVDIENAKIKVQPSCYDKDAGLYTLYLEAANFKIVHDDFDDEDDEY